MAVGAKGGAIGSPIGGVINIGAAGVVDRTGTASGDSTADGFITALGDFTGTASGDSTASGALTATGDFTGTASGDSTADGVFVAFADATGTAQGDSTANGALTATGDFVGSASGDSTADGFLDALADFTGTASGDATCDGFILSTTVEVPTVTAGGVGVKAWASHYRKPKKKRTLLEELDDLIVEAQARIAEQETIPSLDLERARQVRAAIAAASHQTQELALAQLNLQIEALHRLIQEMDDEEAILLLAA